MLPSILHGLSVGGTEGIKYTHVCACRSIPGERAEHQLLASTQHKHRAQHRKGRRAHISRVWNTPPDRSMCAANMHIGKEGGEKYLPKCHSVVTSKTMHSLRWQFHSNAMHLEGLFGVKKDKKIALTYHHSCDQACEFRRRQRSQTFAAQHQR